MAEPVRDQILDKVADVLKTISTGNGYHTTPALVTRDWRTYDQCNEFPVLIVTEAADSQPPVIRAMNDWFEDVYRLSVYGYVLGSDQLPRSRALERLYDDVLKVLIANATLATNNVGLVRDLAFDGPRQTDGGLWEHQGVFIQDVAVTYNATYTGP